MYSTKARYDNIRVNLRVPVVHSTKSDAPYTYVFDSRYNFTSLLKYERIQRSLRSSEIKDKSTLTESLTLLKLVGFDSDLSPRYHEPIDYRPRERSICSGNNSMTKRNGE
jgi:hypothetical protein